MIIRFCQAPTVTNIPLRVKYELAPEMLADPRFRGAATEDLLFLAGEKKIYVTDRASAIAVLRGTR